MKALINPNDKAQYVKSWNVENNRPIPVFEYIGSKICQVSDVEFEVASSLFWVDCDLSINDTTHYYDLESKSFKNIPNNAEYIPTIVISSNQPNTTGTQTI